MSIVKKIIKEYTIDISGASMVEYGVIIAAICVAAAVSLESLGDEITAMFTGLANDLS